MMNISVTTGSHNKSSSTTDELPSKAEFIAWCSAFAMEAVFIIVGNLLTLALFAFNKKLRKKSLFLAINMAFADLLLGSVSLPISVYLVIAYNQLVKAFLSFTFINIIVAVCWQASLMSATLISGERFFAVIWPLRHRTMSKRAYRIVIFLIWLFAVFISAVFLFLVDVVTFYAVLCLYALFLLFIVCGLNIGIWRKFQQRSLASQQKNRTAQSRRLTKTLLFVSVIALSSWLPSVIHLSLKVFLGEFPIPLSVFYVTLFLFYSNSLVNPILYVLRISEFKQALGLCCFRRQAVINREGNEGRDNRAVALTPVTQLRTLPTDPCHLQLAFKQKIMDTKL